MQIYVSKNNQQFGPFEEAKVLEMLNNGQFSQNDMAIRQGEKEWQKLGSLYPSAAKKEVAKAAIEPAPPKKSRKGLLLGCAGFFLIAILVLGVAGFLAYRNLNPADSLENLPNTVKNFKIGDRFPPKGNIWGTETNFVGLYSDKERSKSVLYLMTVYSNEAAAKEALKDGLIKTCQSGETPMNFSFIDKNGKEVSHGSTCAVPLYIQKDNKLVALGGSGASAIDFIEFAENLPFNEGTRMEKKEK
jgi:GYF domain 2